MTAHTLLTDATGPIGHRLIMISFYLWWIPIILQGILLAYVGLSLTEAARVGGPAWDILLVDTVPAVVMIAATAAQIAGVFLMRAGHRAWRISLLIIGLVMLWVTTSQFETATSYMDLNPTLIVVQILLILSTIGAIIAMFAPPANAYLRIRKRASAPNPPDEPAPSPGA